jgi:NitT/TauT family transport system substrate-binding protein
MSSCPGFAEVSQINIAQQFGVGYLPLMVMQDKKLVEKEAETLGLPPPKVNWLRVGVASAMMDGLLSGSIDFISGGVPTLVLLWSKTKNNIGVKGVGAMNSQTIVLTTRNPNVKSIRDFTEKDRIAVVTAKSSASAIVLQMAAAKEFGQDQYSKLDHLTVTRSNPDGMIALLSPQSEITAHFGPAPFYFYELAKPGIHKVMTSDEVLGGPATSTVVMASSKFRSANPKTYDAFAKAFADAIDIINKDKRAAAEIYIRLSGDKTSPDDIVRMIEDPAFGYGIGPKGLLRFAQFMHSVGTVPARAESWKDMFFPNAHAYEGN